MFQDAIDGGDEAPLFDAERRRIMRRLGGEFGFSQQRHEIAINGRGEVEQKRRQ